MIFVSTTFADDNTPVSVVLEQCKKYNLNNLELGSNHCWESDILNKVKQYDFNFLAHNYFPVPKKSLIVNIASQDKNIWNNSVKHILNSIDFCNEIGARLYTFHLGFLLDPINTNQNSKNYDFIFKESEIDQSNYNDCFCSVIRALEQIIPYAKKKNVKIAIETEGSRKKEFCFFYIPDEYRKLFEHFSKNEIGINLNIGHLNLASKTFGFSPFEFVGTVADYVYAMELSHNNGVEDQHLPIKDREWYWDIITDNRFKSAYKILEFRSTPIATVIQTKSLLERKCNGI